MVTKYGSGDGTIDAEYGAFPSVLVGTKTIQTPRFRIGDVISSCVFDLDATIEESYSGSGQVWANYERTPADGSAQTAYDFNRGAGPAISSNDPTFNGSAGTQEAYWSFDGGDLFSLANTPQPSFLRNLGKTTGGTDFALALAWRPVDGESLNLVATTTSNLSGIRIIQNATEQMRFFQANGTTNVQTSATAHSALTPGEDYLYIFSYKAGTGIYRSWLNSSSNQSTITFGTTTSDANIAMRLFINATNGTRLYSVSAFNSFFSDDEANKLRALYRIRHARNY